MKSLKNIPPVDELLTDQRVVSQMDRYNRRFIVEVLREAIDIIRTDLRAREEELERPEVADLICQVFLDRVASLTQGTLRRVINGTGVVLHTNLGRAPLSAGAVDYVSRMAVSYNNLEMDLESGERGSRYAHVEELLRRITGAEAALVVNNNAAAVLLGLSTLACQQEVIVSRGQLVEIGGAFRIPEVMKLSGAILREVGTTNKTYIRDYEEAVGEQTALLFAAHTSNYKIEGFTSEVELADLVALGRKCRLPVMQDLGSGILFKPESWGLEAEPTVQECVQAGTDIVTFSGDKLLGGPQAGIIVGNRTYVEAMKKNQLTRALRVDKLTIAALEATLIEYMAGFPEQNLPIIRMLKENPDTLKARAEQLAARLEEQLGTRASFGGAQAVMTEDMVGGGAYPTYRLAGYGVEIRLAGVTLETVARQLRQQDPAVLTRRQEDRLLISVRTLLDGDDAEIIKQLSQALAAAEAGDERGDHR